ncbi:hypothetical protein BKA62DRAFT_249481 [Auriculariales sp. MPI-PUGE-AT-0066]|nr:hypothetical protein BKA62DRAFT_249481 [Auriculariales sp. MPI-PUGE-AT-0066]
MHPAYLTSASLPSSAPSSYGYRPPARRASMRDAATPPPRRMSFDHTTRDAGDCATYGDTLGLTWSDPTKPIRSTPSLIPSGHRRTSSGRSHTTECGSFASQSSLSSMNSFPSPPRQSFDLPATPPTPSKAERDAARSLLHPTLHAAIQLHERELAKERCERRLSWLKRGRTGSNSHEQGSQMQLPDEDVTIAAYSPPPLPELLLDGASERDDDDDEYDGSRSTSPTADQLRYHMASVALRVEFALFRAKKRIHKGLGLA